MEKSREGEKAMEGGHVQERLGDTVAEMKNSETVHVNVSRFRTHNPADESVARRQGY